MYLDAFYIDKYEVTNALYKVCVKAGACKEPFDTLLYDPSPRLNHPVIDIDWNMARTYCQWRGEGSRLPTEAQWEKAARGNDGRTYPWGETLDMKYANYNSHDTKPIGGYLFVKSPYGIYDMTGNVSEWVSDWYSLYYYKTVIDLNISNHPGPIVAPFSSSDVNYGRVLRGGNWKETNASHLSTTYRDWAKPESRSTQWGFRCAKDAP